MYARARMCVCVCMYIQSNGALLNECNIHMKIVIYLFSSAHFI